MNVFAHLFTRRFSDRPCIKCTWHSKGQCYAPKQAHHVAPLTGEKRRVFSHCATHRGDGWLASLLDHTCGTRGRWFQPIPAPKRTLGLEKYLQESTYLDRKFDE